VPALRIVQAFRDDDVLMSSADFARRSFRVRARRDRTRNRIRTRYRRFPLFDPRNISGIIPLFIPLIISLFVSFIGL